MLPRSRGSSSRTTGAGATFREHGRDLDAGALGQAHHAGPRRQRSELVEDGGLHLADERVQARADIGREQRREAVELGRVG